MYSNQHTALLQQQRVLHHMDNADSYSMFNLLTSPQLFDQVEALLPVHRERSFPPTETLSMLMACLNNMAQTVLLADQIPRQLSFKHTIQIWISWQQRSGGGTHDAACINGLL
jgi:hypothetical protein